MIRRALKPRDPIGIWLVLDPRLLLLPFVFTILAGGQAIAQEPVQFQPVVIWNPTVEMDGNLFPSYLIATSRLPHSTCTVPRGRRFGDTLNVIGVVLQQRPTGVRRIRVEVKENEFLLPSECEATLSTLDLGVEKEIEIFPPIHYRFDALRRVRQSVPLEIAFEVFADGQSTGRQTITVQVRSINDCPFFILSDIGQSRDLRYMFAAYVNEAHPWNDSIRKEALGLDVVDHFVGYPQSPDPQTVFSQVLALWEALQREHLTYSNIAVGGSSYGRVQSQHVRFVDEAVHFSQANCVDGTVLFASLLAEIGIDPVLVAVPQHMFVGFYVDAPNIQSRRMAFLETTLIGSLDLKRLPGDSGVRTLGRVIASNQSFWHAIDVGKQEFDSLFGKQRSDSAGPPRPGELPPLLIDLREYRALGIMPISFDTPIKN